MRAEEYLTPRERRVLAIADRISEVLVIACAAVFFGGLLRALLAHFAR
jgi:hypothetical protein